MASTDGFIPSLATCRCIWSLLLLLFRYTTNKFFFFVFFFVRRIQWWWVAEPPLSDYERSVGQRRAMIKPASGDSTGHTHIIRPFIRRTRCSNCTTSPSFIYICVCTNARHQLSFSRPTAAVKRRTQGGPKKLYIFNTPYLRNRSRQNETDLTQMFLEFPGIKIGCTFM